MEEVLPGVWDWEAVYEKLGFPVHSHAVGQTLIDPVLPEEGVEALRRLEPERIVLSNRDAGGDLSFVPDSYMDDPEEEKARLRAGLRELPSLDFDNLLLAHGPPLIGGAEAALRAFVNG